ncbi:hypothetical protein SAV31267_042570 [Streptomyces avermitilis]|uniref:HTH lysR-type domain-containing protein n=1 Tax=Streptomyces avermitilis TaxID=33903 RepID=A0A4D4MRI2_STRAX|nr:hypothetical protein SAV31267_042570 [Streptomyces avermitilis]
MEPVRNSFTVDLRRLGVLRELERRGSLARTAEALHLTPSAVSQQLAALAREVGVPLIVRQGRGARLTGQARVLLEHAEVMAAQWERARADLAAWEEGRRGAVTVGAFSSAVSGLLPNALGRLAEHHPRVRVAVVEAEPPDLFTRLDAGEVDIAVAVDFAAAPPHTDRRYARTDLSTDVLDLALPGTTPVRAGRRWGCGSWRATPGSSGTPAAAAGRSPGRCARRTASRRTSGTPSTTGSRSPRSSRRVWVSRWSRASRSHCTGRVWSCAPRPGRRPRGTSSRRYGRDRTTIRC